MGNSEQDSKPSDLELAAFSERAVAFGVDMALFAAAGGVSFLLAFPDQPLVFYPAAPYWSYLWGALFLFYQAYFSSDGRVSLGKKMVGLRVIDGDGQPLDLGQALIRAVLYLPSSILGLGFFWSLFNPSRQCWHDMAIGSTVVRAGAPKPAVGMLLRAGACACLAVLAVSWMWRNVWAQRYYRIMTVSYAKAGFHEIEGLEKEYHQQNKKYADNLFELAPLSGDAQGFMTDMANLYDLRSDFRIVTGKSGYVVSARANDQARTPVQFAGS